MCIYIYITYVFGELPATRRAKNLDLGGIDPSGPPIDMNIHINMNIHLSIYIYIYTHTHIILHMCCMCVYVYVYIYIYTYIVIYDIYIYICIYVHGPPQDRCVSSYRARKANMAMPVSEGDLDSEHQKLATSIREMLDEQGRDLSDTDAFKGATRSLNAEIDEGMRHVRTKNVELWKVHSDEAAYHMI